MFLLHNPNKKITSVEERLMLPKDSYHSNDIRTVLVTVVVVAVAYDLLFMFLALSLCSNVIGCATVMDYLLAGTFVDHGVACLARVFERYALASIQLQSNQSNWYETTSRKCISVLIKLKQSILC